MVRAKEAYTTELMISGAHMLLAAGEWAVDIITV
jgi:hypothetical protein